MGLINGATYRFVNRADGNRSLNVYGTSPASLANVCLWSSSDTDICQQWIYKEEGSNKYLQCKGNTNLVLDLFTGSSTTANVKNYNAQVYAKSSTSYIEIEEATGDYIKIKLLYNGRYLTANQNSNGTSSGKSVNSSGNVYFYNGGLTDYSQDWLPVLLEGGDAGDEETGGNENHNGQKLIHPFATQYYTVGYEDEAPAYPARYPKYGKHHAVDMYGSGSNPTEICASGNGVIVGTKVFTSLGNVLAVRYDNVIDRQGNNIGSVIVRYCHLASWEKASGTVTKGDKIATEGSSGSGTDAVHLHMEFDTDTDYPLMTPTEGGGVNSTINPLDVLYKSSTQTVKPDCDPPIYGDEYDDNDNAWYDAVKIRNTPIA